MGVFTNCSVLVELKTLPIKEKRSLKAAITENGGTICFVVNKQCSLILTSDASSLSPNRLRSIRKHQTPVVGVGYVSSCLERGALLPLDGYRLDAPPAPAPPTKTSPVRAPVGPSKDPVNPEVRKSQTANAPEQSGDLLGRFRVYGEHDSDLPPFPDRFQVAKYSIYEKSRSSSWWLLELQSLREEGGRRYRVVRYRKDDVGATEAAVKEALVFPSTSEEALEVYECLRTSLLQSGLRQRRSLPAQARELGSAPLQQLLLEERLNTGTLTQEVGAFVELLWTEATGRLSDILTAPVEKLSLNDVSRVEGLLLQAHKKLQEAKRHEAASLLEEVYALMPFRARPPPSLHSLSQKLDVCQLIRDLLNVSEMTLRSSAPSCLGKYRALRCSLEAVPADSSEFLDVAAQLQHSRVQIQQVLRVCRGVELQTFEADVGGIKPLLHSSRPSNFVGLLSRGLLMPRVGVEHHGIERTDAGNLGSGIYFSDAFSTSLKYSHPGATDGSRLLLVCDVALGRCQDVRKRDRTLSQAPDGYHSVHGVRSAPGAPSEFEDDEYVVYSPGQVRLKYVVRFSMEGDQLKEFSPSVSTSAQPLPPPAVQELQSEEAEVVKNPVEDVKAGLLDSSGQQVPLQAVHVRCKLMDLLSQVTIFQKYTNQRPEPIEAKFVFPLSDSAAVCGFEAFINGKHVVGQVKEKETARKEYKQAVERGHGAYLMDQDAPDVFTISVGNLPPAATVLVKVTFVSELVVQGGSILFSLPGSVAPWQESAALNQTTQVTLEKVCVTEEEAASREFTLDACVEMPHEISQLTCLTHSVKTKRTDCKAVVSVLPGQILGPEGFQLSVSLSKAHLPRMWVEKHPEKDSQACMLVFYPDFDIDAGSPPSNEVVLLLDTSESMRDSLHTLQEIALRVLKALHPDVKVNVILFGTDHSEAFLTARPLGEAEGEVKSFVKRFTPVGGSTELWRPLRALSLLPPSRGLRNLLLLSDGHVQNPELTLQLLRDGVQHSRLFACGLSPTANRHMLRALAQAGGGAFEFFDTKSRHTWAEKVACQVKRMAAPGCSSVSVKWQQFNPTAPPPVQAPKQLHALFRDCHTLVYGFVPHCTQATLLGNLSGKELRTMVSTSELQKTRGTFLHKLTARAVIRDYEDGNLDADAAQHEGKKAELREFVISLSKEFSILSQFTSFVAVEERGSAQDEGFTDVPKLIAEEDVDFLPYISWSSSQLGGEGEREEEEEEVWEEQVEEEVEEVGEEEEDEDMDMDRHMDMLFMEEEYGSDSMDLGEPVLLESSRRDRRNFSEVMVEIQGSLCDFFSPPTSPPVEEPCGIGAVQFSEPKPKSKAFKAFAPPPPPPAAPSPLSGNLLFGHSFLAAPPFASFSPQSFSRLNSSSVPTCVGAAPAPHAAPPPPPPPPAARSSLSGRLLSDQSLASAPPGFPLFAGLSPLSGSGVESPLDSPCVGAAPAQQAALPSPPPPPPAAPSSLSGRLLSAQSSSASAPPKPTFLFRPLRSQSRLNFSSVPTCVGAAPAPHAAPPPPPPPAARSSLSGRLLSDQSLLAPAPPGFPLFAGLSRLSDSGVESPLDSPHFGAAPAPQAAPPPPPPAAAPFQSHRGAFGALPPADVLPRRFPARDSARVAKTEVLIRRGKLEGRFSECLRTPEAVKVHWASRSSSSRSSTSHSSTSHSSSSRSSTQSLTAPAAVPGGFRRASPEGVNWNAIFRRQHVDGYWELTPELGKLLNFDVDLFVNVFLKSKGIDSLGARARADILRLLATLLVLQLMRVAKLEEGRLLRTLFSLVDPSQQRSRRGQQVKRAVDWVRWADRQYPCICSRLEFGLSWESSTRHLLGFEDAHRSSPLTQLKLRLRPVPLLVS